MALPPGPPALEELGQRPFSFYPPILGIEHNEWVFRSTTWSEVQVVNSKSGTEIWVSRRFLGAVSRVDEPVMIVGLTRELEYEGGAVWPHERRVIEMPRAVNEGPRPLQEPAEPLPKPAPVIGIKLESAAETRVGRLIMAALAVGLAICVAFVGIYRGILSGSRVHYTTVMQSSLGLGANDDYWSVVHKFGQPAGDRWQSDAVTMQFRLMHYPDHAMTVVLMGTERDKARFIGAIDEQGRPIDSIVLQDGRNTLALLKTVAALQHR